MKKSVLISLVVLTILFSNIYVLAECTDSDGGFSPYIKGTATLDVNRTDFCLSDNWDDYNSKILYEYSCDESAQYYCPNGCSDGACLGSPSSVCQPSLFCFHNDGITGNLRYLYPN